MDAVVSAEGGDESETRATQAAAGVRMSQFVRGTGGVSPSTQLDEIVRLIRFKQKQFMTPVASKWEENWAKKVRQLAVFAPPHVFECGGWYVCVWFCKCGWAR